MDLRISIQSSPSADWDAFVGSQPSAPIYTFSSWPLLVRDVFGHETYFIEARSADGALQGVVPLVRQRSLILGDFLTSLAFFNYGGALALSGQTAATLMMHARDLGMRLGCRRVEFRDVEPRSGDWVITTDKVTMMLELPSDFEALSSALGSKLRSQVKRAERENLQVSTGGVELLDDFYYVFARNMRDLGTPVYPKRFFDAVLRRCADVSQVVAVYKVKRPIAAGLLVHSNETTEIPWAACLTSAKPLGANMKLYWEALRFAVERGSGNFDFGRSSVDSGTYRFKKQWRAQPMQLYWHSWHRDSARGGQSRDGRDSPLMRRAVALWRRLPVPLANALGPALSPYLPW